jgi:hypothetical protein
MRNIARWKAPVHTNVELVEVSASGTGKRRAVFRHHLTDELIEMEADHVVVERGMLAVDDLFEGARMYSANDGYTDLAAFAEARPQPEMKGEGGQFHLYRIGDASASRDIHTAIYDAYRLCLAL